MCKYFHCDEHHNFAYADMKQTLESDSFICVREKKNEAASPEVVIIDLKQNNSVTRRPIKADSAIMHWTKQVIEIGRAACRERV